MDYLKHVPVKFWIGQTGSFWHNSYRRAVGKDVGLYLKSASQQVYLSYQCAAVKEEEE